MKKLLFACSFLMSFVIQAQTLTSWTDEDGLPANSCNDVSVDATGNIWVATSAGVGIFDGSTWEILDETNGLVDDNVLAILVASDGKAWMGTNFGISVYDGSSWTTYTEADGMEDDQIRCITEDADGNLWFGTGFGASSFDGTTWTNYGSAEGLPFGGVNDILQDDDQTMTFATGLSGVAIQDEFGVITLVEEEDGLINDRMRALAQAPNGDVWAASAEGINILAGNDVIGQFTTVFNLPPPDTLNPFEDVIFDLTGNTWAAVYVDYLVTEGGVSVYDGSTWQQFDVNDGLAGPVVRKMAVDQDNSVWVTTSTGLTRISDFDPLSIDEVAQNKLTLSPNPTQDRVTIEIPSNFTSSVINVYDALGRSIQSEEIIGKSSHNIQLGHLEKGTYLIVLNSGEERFQEWVVVR